MFKLKNNNFIIIILIILTLTILNLIIITYNNYFFSNYNKSIHIYIDMFPLFLIIFNFFICYSCILFTNYKLKNNIYYYIPILTSVLILTNFLFLTNDILLFFIYYEFILLPSAVLCYISSPNMRSKYITYYFIL